LEVLSYHADFFRGNGDEDSRLLKKFVQRGRREFGD
jgi:hypothetical protein